MMRLLSILLIVALLSACGSKRRPAKVDEINPKNYNQSRNQKRIAKRIENKKNKGLYKVKKGDTLYSIGFKYDMDYKFLAQINGINKPYRIYPGQTLKLKADSKKSYVTTQALKTTPIITSQKIQAKPLGTPKKNNTEKAQKKTAVNKTAQVTSTPSKKQPVTVAQKPEKKPAAKPAPKTVTKPKVIAAKTPDVKSGNITWSWPTAGKIRSTFLASNPARKGISIGGKEGQAVKAAAAGVVVYSGSGLLGYGELIIIKHNDQFLSAYGHNKKRLVTEGQAIKKGQTIAELGSSGTNVDNLHFEIRKNGKPVNPLNYVKP